MSRGGGQPRAAPSPRAAAQKLARLQKQHGRLVQDSHSVESDLLAAQQSLKRATAGQLPQVLAMVARPQLAKAINVDVVRQAMLSLYGGWPQAPAAAPGQSPNRPLFASGCASPARQQLDLASGTYAGAGQDLVEPSDLTASRCLAGQPGDGGLAPALQAHQPMPPSTPPPAAAAAGRRQAPSSAWPSPALSQLGRMSPVLTPRMKHTWEQDPSAGSSGARPVSREFLEAAQTVATLSGKKSAAAAKAARLARQILLQTEQLSEREREVAVDGGGGGGSRRKAEVAVRTYTPRKQQAMHGRRSPGQRGSSRRKQPARRVLTAPPTVDGERTGPLRPVDVSAPGLPAAGSPSLPRRLGQVSSAARAEGKERLDRQDRLGGARLSKAERRAQEDAKIAVYEKKWEEDAVQLSQFRSCGSDAPPIFQCVGGGWGRGGSRLNVSGLYRRGWSWRRPRPTRNGGEPWPQRRRMPRRRR